MITLADEFTDRKERRARGWLFFDAECAFCTRIARWLAPALARRGLALAPLQDARVGALLGLSRLELLKEMRFLSSGGTQLSGADAVLGVAREVWWARPFARSVEWTGTKGLMDMAYRWIAARRGCNAGICAVPVR